MSDAYFVFPSDADRAENEDLNRTCEFAEELLDELDRARTRCKLLRRKARTQKRSLGRKVERLRALWEKETERAHVAEGELLKSRVRLVTIKQERDQLKVSLNSVLDAVDGVRKAPRRAGHQLNHPDPKAERDAWRKLNSACDQAISGSTATHDAGTALRPACSSVGALAGPLLTAR
jgi:hypothetical protein